MAAGSLTLGGNMSLALGPLGRSSEAAGALNVNGQLAAMYSYSRSRGLFGGVSIEGSVIVEREDANILAYDSPVTAKLLLGGHVDPPTWASPLIKTLETCTGLPGNRQWINDQGNRTPGGSYIFGALASPGSASSPFLGRKKKISPTFPPESWGVETNTGSYFTDAAPHSHSRNMSWNGTDAFSVANADSDSELSSNRAIPQKSNSGLFDSPNSFSSIGASFPPQHRRNLSLDISRSPFGKDDMYDIYTSHPNSRSSSSMSRAVIKPREELTRPLLPHEGIARAIALFNFDAVEEGDLSFKKGDVVVITEKSNSTDDWWTGKIGNRQGIFPANFVEIA